MKDKIYELKVRWFCRNCWKKGIVGITIRAYSGKFTSPTQDEILGMARFSHYQTDCITADIRLHYDSKERAAN